MSNSRAAKDVLLGKAKLPEKTVPVYLRGDLVSRIQEVERSMAAASAGWTRTKLDDQDPGKPFAEEIEALRAEMQASEVALTLRAISRKAKSDLIAASPSDDPRQMFDPDKYLPALVHACCVDPQFDSAEEVAQFFDEIGASQSDVICDAAWSLVNDRVTVPFSVAASVLTGKDSGQK